MNEAPPGGDLPRPAALALATAALVASLTYLFWPEVSTGFRLFSGERYDGFIALAIHEHWWHALRGLAPVNKVAWFHAWPNTLAYNDGYLLHGLIYAPLRALGANPFLAYDLSQILQKTVGFVALLLIGRRVIGLPWLPTILAATLSTTLPALVQELHHAQFAALGPAYFAAWMGLEAARALLAGWRQAGLAWSAGAAILYGLVLLTSFYVAWGVGLVALVATVLFILTAPRRSWQALRPSPRGLATLAAAGILLVLAITPALLLYLPVVKQTGLHSREMAQLHGGHFQSLIALGETSLLWGWMHDWVTCCERSPLVNGLAPVFLTLSVAALAVAAYRACKGGEQARLLLAMGSAALLLSLMSFSWGLLWPWSVIWTAVPGAGAFRVPSRIIFIAAPALAFVLAWMVWRLGRRSRALALGLVALLVADGWRGHMRLIDTTVELARLHALPPPPAACAAFAATRPREGVPADEVAALYSHNVEAMLLAAYLNLPTPNGYSTFLPPGWDLNHPEQPNYAARVRDEAEQHGFENALCGLDLKELQWSGPAWPPASDEVERMPVLHPGAPILANSSQPGLDALLRQGWNAPENWGTWTKGSTARLRIRLPPDWTTGGTLELMGSGFAPPGTIQTVRANAARMPRQGSWVEGRFPAEPPRTLALPFTPADVEEGVLRVTLQVERPTSAASIGVSADTRPIGFALQRVSLAAGADLPTGSAVPGRTEE
ncbi:hypothetical protein [Roseomonas sp. WA12]